MFGFSVLNRFFLRRQWYLPSFSIFSFLF